MGRLLVDPFEFPFMVRALVEIVMLAVVGGVVGVHVLLRRLTFLTEALQHTVLPGIAIAFAAGVSLLVGALAAALVTVMLLTWLARRPRVDTDSALAVLIAGFFALGVVIVSRRHGFASDLSALLFGRILDVDTAQLVQTAVAGALCLLVVAALHKELVARAFDARHVEALGYDVRLLDLALDVCVALLVVAAVRAVGTVLVIAFVVTPAATAQLVSRRVLPMMALAGLIGVGIGWLALGVSFDASVRHGARLPAGATIVVGYTLAFLAVAAAVAVGRALTRRRAALAVP